MTLDPRSSAAPLFRSFWIGGYEGADHLNSRGEEVAMNLRNGHAQRRDEDYARLARLGIRTIRESIGWRSFAALGAPAGRREIVRTAQLAARHGLQVIWTLHHYGVPDGVDLFADDFAPRFAGFCDVVARSLRDVADLAGGPLVFQPVNEISFLSWAASSTSLMHPFLPTQPDATERAHALKCNLVRAALRGTDALWATWPDARIVHNDPLIHVVPATESVHDDRIVQALHGDPAAWVLQARALDDAQYEAWDMLCGRREPSLGGAPRYLDVLGLNYYHSNQWEHPTNERLHWHVRDPRRRDLADMLAGIWQRYGRPLFIAETGHVGDGRAQWIDEVATAAQRCRIANVPLEGICLYPLVDRPDWEDTQHWHRSGLWDVERRSGDRQIHLPSLRRLLHWQANYTSNALPLSPLSSTQTHPSGSPMTPTLIVFSHLRWDFVYQRPQQLLSRLAQHFHVVFVEEPMPGAAQAVLETLSPCDGVTVLRPHLAGTATGFHDDHIPQLQMLLAQHLEASGTGDYWLWFYTPMAMPLAAGLQPVGVVYDCMDELSAFRHAPRQLLQRESALFHMADLVFTGGQSLYESKRERHADTHCFPSSVDAAHFSPPSRADADHPAQAGIARPRLGYCGVIDERIDLSLFEALADAHPEWQIVAVGPVVKIDRAALPQRDNIHWLGQRSYQDLPELIAGWDVCLMPFALNEATRYISPTKTLEYMAADKPIVSTPIRDVVCPYAGLVGIADDAQTFVRACEDMLALDDAGRARQAAAREEVLQSTSWDRTADQMAVLMALTADKKRRSRPAPAASRTQPAAGRTDDQGPASHPIVILGAGPTGLAAALHAGQDALLVEQNETVGGWCRSIEDKGFTFDCAGHIMFSTDPYVLALYERLLGDNLHWQNREAWIYSKEVYTRYPFQSALHGLPPDVLKECLVGAIEARFGSLDKPTLRVSPTGPSRAAASPAATAPPAVHTATAAPAALPATPPAMAPRNFEEFIYKVWGKGVARHFAIPYNRKLWAVPLSDMETSWLGGRVPMPDLDEMIEGALQPVHKPIGPNARFGYPLRGGFQALMNGFLPLLEGPLALGTRVTAVSPSRKTVSFDDGRTVAFDTLINTMPLPRLVEAIGAEAPAFVREAARQLRHVSVRCVNLGVARENITDKHWIYYPEDTVFHRVFVQGNASPHCNAPGGFGLTCEITYSPSKPLPAEGQALIQRCIDDAVSVGLLRPDDAIVCANEVDMPIAYVVYDHARAAHVEAIRSWLADAGILLAGRYSEWAYYNSDHAFVAGHKAAEAALKLNADAAPRAVAAAA
ncbi:FAD-dependent oxidoreductase [Variovorax sp. J22G73]|uniref:FAD-dependent oxidoreductase n=1 Tax=unclassified Variovorax TaxID=663243 RepID=UPI0025786276|nr:MULTISPECIES: FAD-dependent oxidoreductase [unclassified Variovorax]MDM0009513.1 FAD-dependent oxidoreductase [Variovorax sp. J22R203]MDM0102021.1 FAD-dependent oxidoreductase [Variovorax sp. J22G73]